MKDIRGLGNIAPNQIKPKQAPQKTEDLGFAKELEKTVQQLENMDSQIEAMIQGKATDTSGVTKGIKEVGNMIQSMQGLVDNFAPEDKAKKQAPNQKFAAGQYEKMNPKKDS